MDLFYMPAWFCSIMYWSLGKYFFPELCRFSKCLKHLIIQYQKVTFVCWLVELSGLGVGCEPNGRWCDSQSGPMPGLQTRSPVGGVWEATTHWCFSPSLSPSFPLSLKINKFFTKKKSHLLILPLTSSENSLGIGKLSTHSDRHKFSRILIFVWKLEFYNRQQTLSVFFLNDKSFWSF